MEQGDVATVRGLEGSTETGRHGPDARVRWRRAPRAERGCARWRSTTSRSIPRASSARGSASTATSRSRTASPTSRQRGNLDNLRRVAGAADGDFRGLPFADSDVYKTLEAAGWELARGAQPALDDFVDETTRLLADGQEDDGYLNSYYQGVHPDRKLREFRLGPRDVLRRAPDPGRRRRRRAHRSRPAAGGRDAHGRPARTRASAGRARTRSTATPRSRPRSSSSTA